MHAKRHERDAAAIRKLNASLDRQRHSRGLIAHITQRSASAAVAIPLPTYVISIWHLEHVTYDGITHSHIIDFKFAKIGLGFLG